MPGLWKAWKAKSRLPTLSTSPLGISPRAGEIPTFPQRRRRRRMEKWKTKSRFPTFPPPRLLALSNQRTKPGGGLRPPPGVARPSGADLSQEINERRHRAATTLSGSPRIGIEEPFQAHRPLESILDFRLISGLENAGVERETGMPENGIGHLARSRSGPCGRGPHFAASHCRPAKECHGQSSAALFRIIGSPSLPA
jgi:hypothetical protein